MPEIPAAQNAPVSSNISQKQGSAGFLKNNRLEVFEDKRYRYDTHGNLIEKKIGAHTVIALTWDVEHQLIESVVTRHANDPTRKTTQRTQYRYDAFGRRVEKRDAFGVTHFTWDGNRLLSETRGSKTLTFIYEPESFAPLAQIESATQAAVKPPGNPPQFSSSVEVESSASLAYCCFFEGDNLDNLLKKMR